MRCGNAVDSFNRRHSERRSSFACVCLLFLYSCELEWSKLNCHLYAFHTAVWRQDRFATGQTEEGKPLPTGELWHHDFRPVAGVTGLAFTLSNR